MPRETRPDLARRSVEAEQNQPWVIQQPDDGRLQRTQDKTITRRERRGLAPIFRPGSKVALAEDQRDKVTHVSNVK
jgi:hypothetical protein